VWECKKQKAKALLGFAHRGFERRLTTFGDEPIGADRCLNCTECVQACPTGALVMK
jgi:formate dehydrogenase major subunit/NADH-quinone oxidoreductase subunit G